MSNEPGQTEDSESEQTDTLPALDADGSPLDRVAALALKPTLIRGAAFDLPRLDETVRSVEERIARQDAELATLTRRLERALEGEATAAMRAESFASELGELRALLEAERERSRDIERALFEKSASLELGRARTEDAARESLRLNEEARSLRDALAVRDATIVQVVNSLAERDSQLSALQREHAHLVPELVARSALTDQAEADLQTARTRIGELESQIETRTQNVAALTARLQRGEAALSAVQGDLTAARAQTAVAQEQLQSREWRRGYRHSQWQDRDSTGSLALQAAVQALEMQRDELKRKVAELSEAQIAALGAAERAAQREAASAAYRELVSEGHAADGAQEGEAAAAATKLAADDAAQTADDLLTLSAALAAAQAKITEQSAQITELHAAAETTQDEMTVLLAHLQAARKQTPEAEDDSKRKAELKRWSEELANRELRLNELQEENRELKGTIERTRGALDEREFLIRRLERSESNNATVLGRLQNSIERLGVAPDSSPTGVVPSLADMEPLAELPSLAELPALEELPSLAHALSLADALSLTETPPSAEIPPSAEVPAAPAQGTGASGAHLALAEPPDRAAGDSNVALLPHSGAAAKLIRTDGGAEVIHVLHRRTQIGRLPGLELHIDSSSVSRRHAVILTAPGGAIVEDCMSTNGTYVNGVKVSRQLLRDGDVLTIGEVRFRFVAERPPARRE